MISYPAKKETVNQINVGYMAHYLLNKHRTHREQVINFFQSPFK